MASKYPHVERALEYAEGVVAGEIVACELVKLTCARQLNDLKRKFHPVDWPYRFDLNKAERVCNYIELLPHIKGEWAGTTITLEPWQCLVLTTIFGWVYKETDLRRFRTAYVEVPRKNAKSTLSSGLMLYMGTADGEPGAECIAAATTRKQAKLVFDPATKMVQKTRALREKYGVRCNKDEIIIDRTDSVIFPVSSEAGNLDGLNVHFGCVDELHAHKSRALYDVVETACGARRQSLLSVITTGGTDIAGICYELHEYLEKILKGVFRDESFFGVIYTIDEGVEWTSELAFRMANPMYEISVKKQTLINLAQKARRSPASMANFKTKHLNIWARTHAAWGDLIAWAHGARKAMKLEDFHGKKCWIGLDAATKLDVTALILLFFEEGEWWCFGRYYLPEDVVEERQHTTHDHYAAWAAEGRFILTPGNVTDLDFIEEDILDICSKFDVQSVGYDPWQTAQLSSHLLEKGVPMVEVRPTVANFSEPMKELEALVRSKKLNHGGCPVLTWMYSNVTARYDKKDNIYPNKDKPENKIDGIVALIIAIARAIVHTEDTGSVYESRGVIGA